MKQELQIIERAWNAPRRPRMPPVEISEAWSEWIKDLLDTVVRDGRNWLLVEITSMKNQYKRTPPSDLRKLVLDQLAFFEQKARGLKLKTDGL